MYFSSLCLMETIIATDLIRLNDFINTRCLQPCHTVNAQWKFATFMLIILFRACWGSKQAPQNMPQRHIILHSSYLRNSHYKRDSLTLSSPWKQEINLPCDRYPSYTGREEDILICRDREFRPGGYLNKACHFLSTLLPKSKLLPY